MIIFRLNAAVVYENEVKTFEQRCLARIKTCDSSVTQHYTSAVPVQMSLALLRFFPSVHSLSDFAGDRTNSIQLVSVHFSSTRSSRTRFSLLSLLASRAVSLPEPFNLLTFSTPSGSVSRRPTADSCPALQPPRFLSG